MGEGFAILIWDNWGSGLIRVNPRLLSDGTFDMYGNPVNWWTFNSELEKKRLIRDLTRNIGNFQIID